MSAPYISVVIASRNDNHGGDMLLRMQAFLDCWVEQARRYNLSSEVVIVEWNPPADRPPLQNDLRLRANPECAIRFVEVPREIHERFPNAAAIPLHQMIAKNVGIRRARGEFVLATNLDILCSAPLMQFLAQRTLQPGVMYRMDRLDIANQLPEEASVDELLAYSESHVRRVFAHEGDFSVDAQGIRQLDPADIVSPDSGIRLVSGWHGIERSDFEQYRWTDPEATFHFERPANAAPRLVLDVEAGPSAGPDAVEIEVLAPDGLVFATTSLRGRALLRLHMPPAVSSARLALRVRGRGLPLLRDLRILHLRVLGMHWEPLPDWLVAADDPGARCPASAVQVVSTNERQIQFAVRPLPQADLAGLAVQIRDASGNIVLDSAAQPGSGPHSVTLTFNFAAAPGTQSSGWSLEIARAKAAQDWTASYHAVHPMADQIRRAAYLHTQACGDFTLLAREDWMRLRGYPEFPIWPMHIDALLCYAAYHAGIREEVLRDPMRIYHIEHLTAAGWTPEGEKARRDRLAAKGLTEMQFSEFARWVHQMRRLDAPLIFTLEDWGLGNIELRDETV